MFVSWRGRSDAKVVQQVLAGHPENYGILIERHLTAVHAMIRGYIDNPADTEDIAQESFLTAFQKLDTLRSPKAFAPWLISIARNTALMWQRRRKHETLVDTDTLANFPAPVQPMERQEVQRLLHQGLRLLEEEPREILLLHYYGGKSLREIAVLLNISREAAAKRLQRARAALSDNLLETMGKKPVPQKEIQRQSKKILAAVLAAPVAWQASAAQAAVAGTGALLIKCVAGLALTTVAGTGLWVAHQSFKPEEPIVASPQTPETPVQTAPEPLTPAPETTPPLTDPLQAFTVSSTPPEGPCRIEGKLLDIQENQMNIPATIFLERITWNPGDLPPSTTDRWSTTTGADGHFTIEHLPYGNYAVAALAHTLGSAEDVYFHPGYTSANIKLFMVPVAPLTGSIEDESGTPIPDAVIYPVAHSLEPSMEFSHTCAAIARTISAPDGAFHFPAIPPGGLKFFVLAENYPPVITDFLLAMGGKVKITLKHPGSVSGYVINAATGQRLPNIRLCLHAGSSTPMQGNPQKQIARIHRETETDAEGRYTVDALAPGNYTLSLDDAVLAPAEKEPEITLASNETKTDADFPVTEGATIAGRILDVSTKEGVPGLVIKAYNYAIKWDNASTTTNNGNFLFTGIPKGTIRLYVDGTSLGYVQKNWGEYQLDVQPGQTIENFEIALAKGLEAEGRVLDASGRPVENAEVILMEPNNKRPDGKITTDQEGKFHLPLFNADETIKICAVTEGWRSKALRTHLNAPNLDLTLRLDIPATARIEGRILAPSGKPISHASIYVSDAAERRNIFCETHTNRLGQFTIEHLPAGELKFDAFPAMGGICCVDEIITLQDHQTLKGLEYQCGEEGTLRIAGKIVDPQNQPVPFARVSLWRQDESITTGTDGLFSFEKLPPDEYTLEVTNTKFADVRENHIPAGKENLVITLHTPVEITGTVVDATTNTPIDDFDLEGHAQNGRIHKRQCRAAQGRFMLDDVAPGKFSLTVTVPGYTLWKDEALNIIPETVNEVSIALAPGGIVEGRVLDEAGQPIQDVYIGSFDRWNFLDFPSEYKLAQTGPDGAFTLASLEPGKTCHLAALHANYAPEPFDVSPIIGKNPLCTITLHPDGNIALQIFLDQSPVASCNATTSVYPSREQPCAGCTSDAQGLCTLKHLALGTHIVKISLRNENTTWFHTKKIPIEVIPGDCTPQQVHFSSGTAVVEGVITENGQPVQQGHVSVIQENDTLFFRKNAEIEADGRYRIEGVPAGPYEWLAMIPRETMSLYKRTHITFSDNENATINHDFTGRAAIQGHVTGMKPIENVYISLYNGVVPLEQLDGNPISVDFLTCAYASVEPDGSFAMDHLLPGTYTLAVHAHERVSMGQPKERKTVLTLELSDDATTPAELTLP